MKIQKHIIAILGVVVMSIGLSTSTQALELVEIDNEVTAVEETNEVIAVGRTVPYYNLNTSGGSWSGTYYKRDGKIVKDSFFCDGTYTYYLQADGTPMKNKLSYHPDGVHLIYFDDKGHELFDKFQYCKDVKYTCYFDTYGYLYKDKITFSNGKAYYLDGDGRMKQSGWFKFANGVDYGYAYSDGSLNTSGFGYDPYGRQVFYHWNGIVARGLITDGVWYYHMDETDGHYLGRFLVNNNSNSSNSNNSPNSSDALAKAKECLNLINEERRRLGVGELTWDDTVYGCCQIRATEINTLFSHTRPDGSSCFTVLDSSPDVYWGMGECIYKGSSNPQSAFNAWKNSSGHYEIMIDDSYNRAALALDGNAWVLITVKVP